MPRFLYLVHDLDDPAVWRRVAMLRRGGATVDLAGFRRADTPLPEPATLLGRTRNAKLGRRMVSVARASLGRIAPDGEYDAIIARNLEMLVLAGREAKRLATRQRRPRLVYEVLDIHRLLVRHDIVGRTLRAVERRLCRAVDLLLVSSPAFVTHHFDAYGAALPPVRLVENKVTIPGEPDIGTDTPAPPVPGAPITIGWFGILRCAFSLACLDAVTRATPGRYRVILRGRPARDALPDFDDVIAANPDMVFAGPYRYPEDLSEIYNQVDLAWLVDRYDAGENSDWLLPNRLYESGRSGVPPICLSGTEVARRAGSLGIGVVVEAPSVDAAVAALGSVDATRLASLRRAQAAVPESAFVTDDAECRALVAEIAGPSPETTAAEPSRALP